MFPASGGVPPPATYPTLVLVVREKGRVLENSNQVCVVSLAVLAVAVRHRSMYGPYVARRRDCFRKVAHAGPSRTQPPVHYHLPKEGVGETIGAPLRCVVDPTNVVFAVSQRQLSV